MGTGGSGTPAIELEVGVDVAASKRRIETQVAGIIAGIDSQKIKVDFDVKNAERAIKGLNRGLVEVAKSKGNVFYDSKNTSWKAKSKEFEGLATRMNSYGKEYTKYKKLITNKTAGVFDEKNRFKLENLMLDERIKRLTAIDNLHKDSVQNSKKNEYSASLKEDIKSIKDFHSQLRSLNKDVDTLKYDPSKDEWGVKDSERKLGLYDKRIAKLNELQKKVTSIKSAENTMSQERRDVIDQVLRDEETRTANAYEKNATLGYIKSQNAYVKKTIRDYYSARTSAYDPYSGIKLNRKTKQWEANPFEGSDKKEIDSYSQRAQNVNQLADAYKNLDAIIKTLPYEDQIKAYEMINAEEEKFRKNVVKNAEMAKMSKQDKLDESRRRIDEMRLNAKNWTAAKHGDQTKLMYKDYTQLPHAIEAANTAFEKGKISAKKYGKTVHDLFSKASSIESDIKLKGKDHLSFPDKIKNASKRLAVWFGATTAITQAVSTAKEMVKASVDIESSMAQLQIVTGASGAQLEQFFARSSSMAKDLGKSVTDVLSSVETFSRLGYGLGDASKLAKYANIMSNVAAVDIDTATTGITSIIKGYGMTPDDAEHVSDVLTAVGQKYAISAEELMAAFQRGGAALAASGTDFEKSAALFAATNASLQNAESVGTMWKTVSARIRGAKTELSEMGESTDDLADGFSKYRKEIKALSGIDIMKDENHYRDMYDIFVDLAKVWDNMKSDEARARVAEILGGTRQASGIMSTITNIKDAIGAYDVAMNSAGESEKANNIVMETTAAKLQKLRASFQTFSKSFVNNDIFKVGISGFTGLLELLEKFTNLTNGAGSSALTAGIGFGAFKLIRTLRDISKARDEMDLKDWKNDRGSIIGDMFSDNFRGISRGVKAFKDARAAGSGMFKSLSAGSAALFGSFSKLLIPIAAVSTALVAYKAHKEHIAKLVSEANDAGDTWKQSNKSLSDYKDKIIDLKTQMSSGDLSDSQEYKLKSELLSIQNEITSSYGNQVEGINLVNGSLETQLSLLDKISQESAGKYLNENTEGIDKSIREMEKKRELVLAEYGKGNKDSKQGKYLHSIVKEINKKYKDKYSLPDDLIKFEKNSKNESEVIKFKGDATQADEVLNEFMNRVRAAEDELGDAPLLDTVLSVSGKSYKEINDVLDESQDVYKKAKEAQMISDTSKYRGGSEVKTAAEWLSDYASSVEEYNDALVSGDPSSIKKARSEFEKIDGIVSDLISSSGMSDYSDLFSDVSDQLDKAGASVEDFKEKLEGTKTPISKNLPEELSRYKDILDAAGNAGAELGQTVFGNIDTDNRQVLEWNKSNLKKFKSELQSWDEDAVKDWEKYAKNMKGSISTVFGASGEYDGLEIAFSPILQTDDGPVLLNSSTVDKYINSIVDKAGESRSLDNILSLDSKGLEVDGVRISGIIADVGEEAAKTGELMHFAGKDGAVNGTLSDLKKYANSAGESFGSLVRQVLPLKTATESLKGLDLTDVDFQTIFNSKEIESGEAEIYAIADAALEAGLISDTSADSISYLSSVLVGLGVISGDPAGSIENISSSMEELKKGISGFKDVQSNLDSALKSSMSGAGVTSEEIDKIEDAYKSLRGYNPRELFEETSNGIHLNREELRRLNKEYSESKIEGFSKRIEELNAQILEKESKGEDVLGLKDQLYDLQLLKSELEGTMSAYNQFQNALSGPKERDMYESVGKSYDSMKEILDQGWYGDESLNKYLDLMLSASQRSGDVVADFEKLGQTIDGTQHSLRDYFITDDKGNFVTDGIHNFLSDVQKVFGEGKYVGENTDGSLWFDFDDGGVEAIAEKFGTSTEMVELFERAMIDAGAAVDMSTKGIAEKYPEIDDLTARLSELQEAGQLSSDLNLDFKVDEMGVSDLKSQIDSLKNERIQIDAETNPEAAAELDLLISRCEQEYYVKINTQTDGQLERAAELLNQVNGEYACNVSVTSDDSKLTEIASELAMMDKSVQIAVGISPPDVGNIEAIKENLRSHSLTIPVNFLPPQNGLGIQNPTADLNIGNVLNAPTTVPNLTTNVVVDQVIGVPTSAPTIYQTVIQSVVKDKKGSAFGSISWSPWRPWARATGSIQAFAKGSKWSLDKSETSLVNELGTESIVRDGRWFPIPGGAHTEQLKRGDIVFSADQTAEILKYGKAMSGGGHGRLAMADGTAFNMLNAYHSGSPFRPRPGSSGNSHSAASNSKYNAHRGSTNASRKNYSKNNDKSSDKDFEETFDFIEIAIQRVTEAIDRLKIKAESVYKTFSARNNAMSDEIDMITYQIDVQNQAYDRYMQQANAIGLAENWASWVRDGGMDISVIKDEALHKQVKDYQEYYEKAIEAKDAVAELREEISKLYNDKFDSLSEDFGNQVDLKEHLTKTYQNGLDMMEEEGHLLSENLYKAMIKSKSESVSAVRNEQDALVRAMSDAVNSGSVEIYSDAWYKMQIEINDTKEKVQEMLTEIEELNNKLRELNWEHFDYLQERISDITEESDFLIDSLDEAKMFEEDGTMSDTGKMAIGLHGQNYNVYMAQADKYAKEIEGINKEIANDPNDTKLLERREELLDAQRESILSAKDEKEAIVDLVEDAMNAELDALNELIDKRREALESSKDLYDYQKKIEDQSKEISSLEKQMSAYQNDNSEEKKAIVQKLKVELEEAKENLKESEYDKYVSDQTKLMDNLYDEYEKILNERLDNVDALVSDMIDATNSNANIIAGTIQSEADKVGYTLSESMNAIWSGEGNATSIITKYGDNFSSALTSVNNVLNNISNKLSKMLGDSEWEGKGWISGTYESTNPIAPPPPPPAPAPAPSTSQTSKPITVGGTINAGNSWIYSNSNGGGRGYQYYSNDPIYTVLSERNGYVLTRWHKLSSGYTGWFKKSDVTAYKNGGLVDYTGIAQLDGTPSKPEMVLNAKDTRNFIDLKDALRSVVNNGKYIGSFGTLTRPEFGALEKLTDISSLGGNGNTNIRDINYEINIPIDKVSDYNDFVNKMRDDTQFEKLIQSMTVDRLTGGSKLSKNQFRW